MSRKSVCGICALVLLAMSLAFAGPSYGASDITKGTDIIEYLESVGLAAPGVKPDDSYPRIKTPASDLEHPPVPQDDWIELNLSYATYLPDSNPGKKIVTLLQERLDKYMPGKVKITFYGSGTLLAQSDIYDGILSGIADMGMVDLGMIANRYPLSQLFVYPAVSFNSACVATMAFQEWVETTRPAEFDDVVFLQAQGGGPLAFYTRQKLSTLGDVKGKQIRATAVLARTIEKFGAVPVTMETGEVYEAMRNGLIDGLYNNFGAAAVTRLEEVGHYALITPLGSPSFMHVMNKEVFNSMPQTQQEAFMRANKETFWEFIMWQEEAWLGERIYTSAQQSEIEYLEGDGLQMFFDASRPLVDEYVKELDAKGLNGTEHLKTIQEITEKYNADFTWDDFKAYFPH